MPRSLKEFIPVQTVRQHKTSETRVLMCLKYILEAEGNHEWRSV